MEYTNTKPSRQCPQCESNRKIIYNYGVEKSFCCYDCGYEYKKLSKYDYKHMRGKFREK